ncbi:lysine transporter LysE [Pseudomonas alcaligenes]|uniref:Lysine transporter LysE n=1 Tax=Aquipseudomonas alcaligenes TaxID=43263 RepID=A0ABR7S743_AQUAC|nr:LysE family translocator [Pseudomonas alcaligenes]MBC9252874.1 lysine transporter LysE [Pseudomonas alcaligenes]
MLALFLLVASTHFAALLSPGPDFFLLLRNALLKGRAQADGCAAGIALANLLSMLLVLVALQALAGQQGWVWQGLQWLGGGYFIWLGVSALLARRQLALPEASGLATAGEWQAGMRQGLLASSLNPKLPIFYAGLFGLLREAAMPGWALALCVAWMSLVVLIWDLLLIRLLARGRWRDWLGRHVSRLDRLCGALLLVLGVCLLWS